MTTSANGTTTSPRRAVNVGLWVLQVLLAAFFVFAAAPKLLGDPLAVQMFDQIGFGQWFRHFTGAVELAGAIGLLIPRLCGLAAFGLALVMVGAALAELFPLGAPALALPPLALCLLFLFLAWARRDTVPVLARS
ncbi:DoxX family protein [Saccharopolyspora rhizosphaerae]|uniref:DoxX family protein n=1 Tax=Saccharopolyspora rhizosphaerae TaxID=2492662 RepID=A0A3R8P3E4_9PSEU|nr:DoxX family protein [Saccharopolyspora rhizosphaerae]RRO18742.1 DoxX family protein [Saccharopolyspora rhizosphaerae]